VHLSGGDVRIGRHTHIGSNTRLDTLSDIPGDRAFDRDGTYTGRSHKTGDVVIGDGLWIGVNVYVGPGVTIGDDAVIGANSVVTRDIAAGCIAGGAPARVIREKPAAAPASAGRPG
jgi:acetyltransferase-like isoleucine patch superfamily enzyme